MRSQHTPTPWKVAESVKGKTCYAIVSRDGWIADLNECHGDRLANASFIVRAVNSHEALVDALIMALPYVETALEDRGYKPGVVDQMVKKIREAIALAEGEQKIGR